MTVEYVSQLGAQVRLSHVWSTDPKQEALWRLHHVVIDPRDAGDPVSSDLSAGLDADEPPRRLFVGIY